MRQHNSNSFIDMALGAIAGVTATWVMGKVTQTLYQQESEQARQQEQAARGDKAAYGVAAEKAASVVGIDLTDEERKRLGSKIHWGLGIGMGALYGLLRKRMPMAAWGHGGLYGFAFWLLMDEGANTALGLTPGPGAFPPQTHLRGLIGHLVFGITTDTILQIFDSANG